MKLCASHSTDLLAALRRKGLAHLVRPEHGRTFAERWLRGIARREEFDPYAVAVLEIYQKTTDLGVYVLPFACALCTANRAFRSEAIAAAWTDNLTDLMVVTARTNNLRVGVA